MVVALGVVAYIILALSFVVIVKVRSLHRRIRRVELKNEELTTSLFEIKMVLHRTLDAIEKISGRRF